jgi:hypothetical protein
LISTVDGVTVKLTALLARPPTVTITVPVVAAAGTFALMLVADQFVTVASVPLNRTVLAPCAAPKFVPVIVTGVPVTPLVGERLVIAGGTVVDTVKLTLLLVTPPTVTRTAPVVAPAGTVARTLVADQLVTVASVPLNRTVLAPCVAPKFVPVIVTDVPTGPVVGERLVMVGSGAATAAPLTSFVGELST